MQPTHASSCLNAHRSSGAILVSSLVLLVIITALALGASRITRMQTVEPTRIQQAIVAFQTAETALAAGERVVRAPDFAPPDVPCSQGRGGASIGGASTPGSTRSSPVRNRTQQAKCGSWSKSCRRVPIKLRVAITIESPPRLCGTDESGSCSRASSLEDPKPTYSARMTQRTA
jgi:Tfp pilus assembly protein PilX